MNWKFDKVLDVINKTDSKLLLNGKWGVEREAQRVNTNGCLALTDHPAAFGNKLLNNKVTTDFAESQIELITPPMSSVDEVYKFLKLLTLEVIHELKSELLWPFSMPPILPSEERIPIAKYDDTPEGREKEIYRLGLANRYGKKMQMISGIHFNLSFSEGLFDTLYKYFGNGENRNEFIDKSYFAMARNFLRYRWLLIYLFGASPIADITFNSEIPNATSLRVSQFGYSNAEQGNFIVSYNDKSEYLQNLRKLLITKSEKYSKIGTFRDGKQIQLNENILQKDSEFYSTIRLKQVTEEGESQLDAIEKRGVSYAEVRILDINPFEITGISLQQMYFLQVFMLFCLFEESSYIQNNELKLVNKNHNLVSISGRINKLLLNHNTGGQILIEDWGRNIFRKLFKLSNIMDTVENDGKYLNCVLTEYFKLTDRLLLPSSKILNQMELNGDSFITFGIKKALHYKNQNRLGEGLKNVEGL
ncbi:glutamate--cysteine ligase [Ruminiclostridium cellulolyticum]|uniref:Glutamate--cysteine ligase n=1 Tax=Ruminiclostridium cellulolyticum (strain ATCC 35319 / DSM 5812 / JCM 6584 / H10) TaxID=394503 RepID=B8I2B6_RUMCH|nr:glutamate--cysteine ligase [Ruminiclostridium cellulolyticum]ACL75909.1 glutamate--cysteine ligase [Ruminiclostridium cellulolyticum H10]